jgi:hypothetical protein
MCVGLAHLVGKGVPESQLIVILFAHFLDLGLHHRGQVLVEVEIQLRRLIAHFQGDLLEIY